jgi:hypothetical protein
MPLKGVSAKRQRQYKHIKETELERGASLEDAERIAAATTNKTRTEKGEAKPTRRKRAVKAKAMVPSSSH